jgi:hypothetical protein
MAKIKKPPVARTRWALDSGGFTELSMNGVWQTTPKTYVAEVAKYAAACGQLDWAAIQDWMCEPVVLAKTGLTIAEHQTRTIDSYLTLRTLAPELPFTPVLQGWERDDYLRHVDMYGARGVFLDDLPTVGIGSVCRRQGTTMVEDLIKELARGGLRLHGFGFKTLGLRKVSPWLASSDSMAWSFNARRASVRLEGCTHLKCNNCYKFACFWRDKILQGLSPEDFVPTQLRPLPDFGCVPTCTPEE